jgi:hypothetical protein
MPQAHLLPSRKSQSISPMVKINLSNEEILLT